jgi:two-component system sensor histidine kinase YesM
VNRFSIQTKFAIAYGILVTFFVVALSTFSYYSTIQIIESEGTRNARLLLEQIRTNTDEMLAEIDRASYIVFSNPDVLRALKYSDNLARIDTYQKYNIERLMVEVMFANQSIYSISLHDNQGTRVTTNPVIMDIPFEVLRGRADVADGRFAWMEFDSKLEIFPVVRKIRDMEMKPVGYLRIDIRGTSVRRRLAGEISRLGGTVAVLGGRHILLMETASTTAPGPMPPGLVSAISGAEGSFIHREHGLRALVVYYASRVSPWTYAASIPIQRVTQIAGSIRTMTFVSSLLSIVLFVACSYIIVRRFTRPIREIADMMQSFDLSEEAAIADFGGGDEIGYLSFQFNAMVKRLRGLVNEVVEDRSRLHRQELAALQSQINPHFLYNTLEVVNWMALEKGAEDIAGMVRALSEMMRYSIGHDRPAVRVGDEIEHIRRYLHIQSRRFADRFEVSIEVPPEVLQCQIPRLTLQPIVENCILHGFQGLKRKGRIAIGAAVVDGAARINIADNGVGLDADALAGLLHEDEQPQQANHEGIGLANVHRRLRLSYG